MTTDDDMEPPRGIRTSRATCNTEPVLAAHLSHLKAIPVGV